MFVPSLQSPQGMASGGLLWGHTFFSATAFTPLHPEIWTNSARSSHDHSITSRPPPHHAHRLTSTRLLAMWILPLIGYIGIALGFCFLTLAIGNALPPKAARLSPIPSSYHPPFPHPQAKHTIDRPLTPPPLQLPGCTTSRNWWKSTPSRRRSCSRG